MFTFLRITIIILNIIAAVSLLLACICCFVNPETIWWIGFFGLAYMYLLAANLCFAVFWILSRKKRYAAISIIAVLSVWTSIGKNVQMFGRRISEEEMSGSFKVLSFNAQGFQQMNSIQPDGEELDMFDYLRSEDADIVCFQEFILNTRKNINAGTVGRQLGKMPFHHIELPGKYFGVVTFSKYPIIHRELVYSDKTTNACICSDIVKGSDTIRIYNVHLKSVGFKSAEKQLLNNTIKKAYDESDMRAAFSIVRNLKNSSLNRAQQVEILASHIAQSPYPVIICGDFNDTPTSHTYRKVRGNRKDAFIEAGHGRSTTYSIGHIASLRIDYILHSDAFTAYSYESPRVHLSDHFPVMCRFVKK